MEHISSSGKDDELYHLTTHVKGETLQEEFNVVFEAFYPAMVSKEEREFDLTSKAFTDLKHAEVAGSENQTGSSLDSEQIHLTMGSLPLFPLNEVKMEIKEEPSIAVIENPLQDHALRGNEPKSGEKQATNPDTEVINSTNTAGGGVKEEHVESPVFVKVESDPSSLQLLLPEDCSSERHHQLERTNAKTSCQYCHEPGSSAGSSQHMKKPCPICSEDFNGLINLRCDLQTRQNCGEASTSTTPNNDTTTSVEELPSTKRKRISYPCSVCGKVLQGLFSLRRHLLTHRSNTEISDHASQLPSSSLKQANTHSITVRKRFCQSCHICGKTFTRSYSLRRHVAVHKTTTEQSSCVPKESSTSTQQPSNLPMQQSTFLESELKPEEPNLVSSTLGETEDEAPSSLCLDLCPSREKPQKARKPRIYKRSLQTCSICGKIFLGPYRLRRHMRTHGVLGPVSDEPEKSSQISKVPLQPCPTCGKMFRGTYKLRRHIATHSKPKGPKLCSLCNKYLRSPRALHVHMMIHTDERPYKCMYCPRAFRLYSVLKNHIYTHTGERPFECEQCEKKFSQRGSLIMHMRMHTGERPMMCEICGKTFSGHLKHHMRIHMEEKEYECATCGRKFALRDTLIKHIRVHTGEKPYACPICNKNFAAKYNMNAHVKTHTNEGPYVCYICGKAFTRRGNLVKHFVLHA